MEIYKLETKIRLNIYKELHFYVMKVTDTLEKIQRTPRMKGLPRVGFGLH